jgi:pimeloyl-ACP methyl ester carboxylesterase
MSSVPELERAQRSLLDSLIPEATVRRIAWSQGETQVIEAGNGPPLFFVHGGFGQATEWIPLWPHLVRHHRLIAVDRPGHGLADPYDYRGVDTLELGVTFLVGILDALGLEQTTLVGNSMGGRWGLELALRRPDRLARLILVGAPAGSRRRVPLPLLALRWPVTRPLMRRVFRRSDPNGVRRFFGQVLVTHPERLPEEFVVAKAAGQRRNHSSMLSFATRVMTYWSIHPDLRMTGRWREVQVPVHFLWGDADAFDSPETGRAAASEIPAGARITTIPGAGHLPWLDEPEAVASAIVLALRL